MEEETKKVIEKRSASRFPTFCTVELESGTGITRNLSTTGVCFTTDQPIDPDLMVRCFIPMQRPGRNTVRLRCEGKVVRVNKSEDGWDVAINFTSFEW